MANCRTLILELFRKSKPKNYIAEMEKFQDSFDELIDFLKTVNFL